MATPNAPNALTTRGERRLAMLEDERKTESDGKQAVWVFLWTIFVFKIATVGAIWFAAKGSHEAQAIIFATTWFWFIIPAAAVAGPIAFWRRLRRQRSRREELRRSEWNIAPSRSAHDRTIVVTGDEGPRFT